MRGGDACLHHGHLTNIAVPHQSLGRHPDAISPGRAGRVAGLRSRQLRSKLFHCKRPRKTAVEGGQRERNASKAGPCHFRAPQDHDRIIVQHPGYRKSEKRHPGPAKDLFHVAFTKFVHDTRPWYTEKNHNTYIYLHKTCGEICFCAKKEGFIDTTDHDRRQARETDRLKGENPPPVRSRRVLIRLSLPTRICILIS